MTELIEGTGVEPAGEAPPPGPTAPRGGGSMRRWRVIVLVLCLVVMAAVLTAVGIGASSSPKKSVVVKTIALVSPTYTPRATEGSTDDYHCTLVNPHVTQDSYVISSQFPPGVAEDHHAVLALVPPSLAATAFRTTPPPTARGGRASARRHSQRVARPDS